METKEENKKRTIKIVKKSIIWCGKVCVISCVLMLGIIILLEKITKLLPEQIIAIATLTALGGMITIVIFFNNYILK